MEAVLINTRTNVEMEMVNAFLTENEYEFTFDFGFGVYRLETACMEDADNLIEELEYSLKTIGVVGVSVILEI